MQKKDQFSCNTVSFPYNNQTLLGIVENNGSRYIIPLFYKNVQVTLSNMTFLYDVLSIAEGEN